MKFITIYKIGRKTVTREFDTQEAQDKHTGKLWDQDLMEKIDYIDYNEVTK